MYKLSSTLQHYFQHYSQHQAPFMHQQLAEWQNEKPLNGLYVLHHVPVVPNTLLKIACLVAAGADVVVTNPSFMKAHPDAIKGLKESQIRYVSNLDDLRKEKFDLYFDCGANLYQHLGRPVIGAIELTGTGDTYYREQELDFPVVSIDKTYTKQLETVFGAAESASLAIQQLTSLNPAEKKWLVFGFGKIGRGLSYFCVKNNAPVILVEPALDAASDAKKLGLTVIHPDDKKAIQNALKTTDIVVTATGKEAILDDYPAQWFEHKILANMGVLDEYGKQFTSTEVLCEKKAVNFVLEDPTSMKYIDPEFYAHNIAALQLLNNNAPLSSGVHDLYASWDQRILQTWCQFHTVSSIEIQQWFIQY